MAPKLVIILFLILPNLANTSERTKECLSFFQSRKDQITKTLEDISLKEGVLQVENRLLIKTLKTGSGTEVLNEDDSPIITLKVYEMKPEGDELSWSITTPEKINLRFCAPGIKQGMKGMKIGEQRRIYVHPSLMHGKYGPLSAYGLIYFDIQVEALNDQKKST